MNPVNISVVVNKSGVHTFFVVMDNGTIHKKSENDDSWQQIGTVPGYRDGQQSKPDMASSDKGRKKRGS
jgi:hypothetical protein